MQIKQQTKPIPPYEVVELELIEITITAEQSEAFAWTSAVYDLELVSAAGKVTALLEGAVSVSGEVTTPII